MEMNKKEILDKLSSGSKALSSWYVDRPMEAMMTGPEGAWTAGQHLLHMIKSTKPLAKGVGYPRILLRLKFGKATRPSGSYEELVANYQQKITAGGKATGEYVPREVKASERDLLVQRFKDEMSVLINNIHRWKDEDLDLTVLPHPLIGKITLREMLYFTIYHMEHHHRILIERH